MKLCRCSRRSQTTRQLFIGRERFRHWVRYHRQGNHDEALRLLREASLVASHDNGRDLLTRLLVHLELSCIKSEIGDHQGALADYESLSPLVQIVGRQNPLYFYFYHNELAVEFGELGHLAEAQAACAVALASPFAVAYPEWSETREEIAAKRQSATPSVVAINRVPEAEPLPQAEPQRKPHRSRPRLSRWLARENTFLQRPSITTTAITIIGGDQITQSILDRVLICNRPRAPTALS
jgi:tetratricopeptide (TPR) repeat protein